MFCLFAIAYNRTRVQPKEEGYREKRRQMSLLFGGRNWLNSWAHHHNDLKKRIIRITATYKNGCFGKIDDHPVHTITDHHPTKMDVRPKTFVQIILAAKLLVRHSSTCPNQQRWHLPSLLSLSFFFGLVNNSLRVQFYFGNSRCTPKNTIH